jgi:pimeloyl-ACP methyl ester carboxylesterase
LSRKDESIVPRALDRLSRVLGHLPYTLVLKLIGPAVGSGLPPARREALVNELKKNDPRFLRAQTHSYLAYLDRHGSLAKRFCETGVPAWVVYGEKDDVGITPAERELLTAAPNVTLVEIADTGHFALVDKPDQVAAMVLQVVKAREMRATQRGP